MARTKGSKRNKEYEESAVLIRYLHLQTGLTGGNNLMSEKQVSKITGISRSTLRDMRKHRNISIENEKKLLILFRAIGRICKQ